VIRHPCPRRSLQAGKSDLPVRQSPARHLSPCDRTTAKASGSPPCRRPRCRIMR